MQEDAGVSFDLPPDFTIGEFVLLTAISLALYAAWRATAYYARKHRNRLPWKRLRVWFPSLLVLCTTGPFLVLSIIHSDADTFSGFLFLAALFWTCVYLFLRLLEWDAFREDLLTIQLTTTGENAKDS